MTLTRPVKLALSALTLAAFAIGTSEFVIMGLLVDIAKELKVSIAQSGLLVTAYALGVVIGGPVVAVLTSRLPRKATLIGLVAMFVTGNICCAVSPTYHLLMLSRILTAMCHGTYFGIATVVAVQLVDDKHRTQAVAWVFLGTTLANMLGVPLGTAEGNLWGWRSTFWSVAVIGLLAIAALVWLLPNSLKRDNSSPLKEFQSLKSPLVQIPLLLSTLLNGGLFVVYTYIAPLLINITGLSPHGVTLVLLILGIGLPIGTIIGGKLGDKALIKSLFTLFPVLIIALVIMHYVMPYAVANITVMFIWSTVTFTIAPMLQVMVVNNALGAPNLASTFNQSAFNLGNAFGAWVGSVLIRYHVSYDDLPFAGIIFIAAAILLVALYNRRIKLAKTE